MIGDDIRTGGFTVDRALEEARRWTERQPSPPVESPAAPVALEPPPVPRPRRVRRRRYVTPEDRLPKAAKEGHAFLYIVQSLNLVKVGFSRNLHGRESNIRVDNPHQPVMRHTLELLEPVAREADILFRHSHPEERVVGDWYRMTPEAALEALTKTIELVRRRRGPCPRLS
jgi:hypothetical protein